MTQEANSRLLFADILNHLNANSPITRLRPMSEHNDRQELAHDIVTYIRTTSEARAVSMVAFVLLAVEFGMKARGLIDQVRTSQPE